MSGYRQMNYMNGHEGHRFQSYGKREADAVAEPEADADAVAEPEADAVAEPEADADAVAEPEADAEAYHPYSNWGYNWPMNYNMYSNNWNRPSYTQYRTFYHRGPLMP